MATPAGPVLSGWASKYAPGVMQRMVWYHWGNVPPMQAFGGYAAVLDCRLIGELIWTRPVEVDADRAVLRAGDWERLLVADCAKRQSATQDWMRENNILMELDHETWVRWSGFHGPRGLRLEWALGD